MRIIEIQLGNKTLELVAGLIWHPLQSSGSARAKEILGYAQAGSADLKVMRGDDSPHVGLAKKLDGGKAGQLSAAAVIADALAANGQRNVLVAVPLPDDRDAYVFVSVRDSIILADGDAVGTRDEIRVRLVGDVAYGGWDAVICPEEWGVKDAEERKFDSFFTSSTLKKTKQWKLKETSFTWGKAIVPVALIVAASLGSSYAWDIWKKKKAASAAVLSQQQKEVERGQKLAPSEPPKPWPLMPTTHLFVKACSQAFRQAGLSAGNWKLDSIVCEKGLLTVTWIKSDESAWISHLKLVRPAAVVAGDGKSATVSAAATAEPSNDFATALPSENGLSLRYHDLASHYGMAVRINLPKAPLAPVVLPGQVANTTPSVTPSWVAMPIEVTANFDPVEVASVLDYPGLRFTKIVYAFKAGTIQYQFTGVQYVRPL